MIELHILLKQILLRVNFNDRFYIISLLFFKVFDLVRYAVPHIPKGGAIINVGSVQAWVIFTTKIF